VQTLLLEISWVLFALQGIVLVAFIIGTIRLLLSGAIQPQTISFYNPQHFNIQGVLQATGIVIVSYLGFDAISTLSEEAEDPHRSVGRAIILSILSIGILFVVITVLGWICSSRLSKSQSEYCLSRYSSTSWWHMVS
jgi:amino acid transporter